MVLPQARSLSYKHVKEYRTRRKDQGLCRNCGTKPVARTTTTCEDCGNRHREARRHRAAELKAQGICLHCCISPAVADRIYCAACNATRNHDRRKYKQQVIDAYGGKCACCGEATFEFLSLDHISNDGAAQRRTSGSGGRFYLKVIRDGFPRDLQLLCFNCNCAKGFYGSCPHEQERQ